MAGKLQAVLDQAVASLREGLGDNLYSCCVYGSLVRGNAIEGVSDLNLLIVLDHSSAAAHAAVAGAVERFPQIDPFVLARRGFERSVRCFASKFASIKRHYRVLHGADPLAKIEFDPQMERFLCEQALRNLRLRLVYAFVTRKQTGAYDQFLSRMATPLFLRLSEILRLDGVELPASFEERLPILEKELRLDPAPLRDLLALKKTPQRLADAECAAWHGRIFPVVDAALVAMETRWSI